MHIAELGKIDIPLFIDDRTCTNDAVTKPLTTPSTIKINKYYVWFSELDRELNGQLSLVMNNFLKYKGILGEDLKVSPNITPSDVTDLLEYIQLFIRAKDEVNKEVCKLVYSWIIEDIIEKMLTDIDYAVIEARLSEIGSQVIFTSEIERKELEARLRIDEQ